MKRTILFFRGRSLRSLYSSVSLKRSIKAFLPVGWKFCLLRCFPFFHRFPSFTAAPFREQKHSGRQRGARFHRPVSSTGCFKTNDQTPRVKHRRLTTILRSFPLIFLHARKENAKNSQAIRLPRAFESIEKREISPTALETSRSASVKDEGWVVNKNKGVRK